jgi:hypothetical protein
MKTPKRPDAPIIDEAEYDCFGIPTGDITTYWDVYYEAHARWKRKNRIRQLKATIARQAEENKHLRTALAIRTINDINENNIESLKFIQQHLTVETFQPHIEQTEDHNWMFTWKRPIPRWNKSIIDLHLPKDIQP